MFFLMRMTFWFSLVLLMLPFGGGDDGQQVGPLKALMTVREAVGDIAGICERKPDVCETGKSAGDKRIDDKVSFVKRGRATDIVVEAGAASGFTQANYQERPAEDMVPILLPWGDERRARYQFSGDEYRRAQ